MPRHKMLVGLLLFATVHATPAAAADWWVADIHLDGPSAKVYFVDLASTSEPSIDHKRAWTQVVKKAGAPRRELSLYEFDCRGRTARILSGLDYNLAGKVTSSFSSTMPPSFVPPDTSLENMMNLACGQPNGGVLQLSRVQGAAGNPPSPEEFAISIFRNNGPSGKTP